MKFTRAALEVQHPNGAERADENEVRGQKVFKTESYSAFRSELKPKIASRSSTKWSIGPLNLIVLLTMILPTIGYSFVCCATAPRPNVDRQTSDVGHVHQMYVNTLVSLSSQCVSKHFQKPHLCGERTADDAAPIASYRCSQPLANFAGIEAHVLESSGVAASEERLVAAVGEVQVERPNVLMILVDDLKPALGCYGDSIAQTPNIDRLAARGMRFDLAYCNQAVCAPSRFTLMLGSHSTSTGLYGLGSQLRKRVPDAVTLPQYFAKHGYRTESLGKVFHIGHGNQGDSQSFSVPHFHDKVIDYVDPASAEGGQLTREEAYFTNQQLSRIGQLPRGAAFESPDVIDEAYADGRVAAETVKRLQAARQRSDADGTPFFIVAGFARPHLPFSAPKKYWDIYNPAHFTEPSSGRPPHGAPQVAGKSNGELANYKPVPESGIVDTGLQRQLIHGYYASVSFVDAQIGKVLEELDRQQFADNTIIVLWGDHGFHLGDHGYWTKHTNYEQANRIPLLITAPGVTQQNSSTRQLAQSTDIFPTLAELAGLDVPRGPQPIDGRSLVSVLRDPSVRVRDHAYHVFPKAKLGRAIRTERYRLVEWRNIAEPPESAELELYDYETDPHETQNVAADQPQEVEQLRAILGSYPEPVAQNE